MTSESTIDLIQSIRGGASHDVYRAAGDVSMFDGRGYGSALKAAGWKRISDWARNIWDEEGHSAREVEQFLTYALDHRSLPMLSVVAIALYPQPLMRKGLTERLTENHRQRLIMLLSMGDVMQKSQGYLQSWKLSLEDY
jgi:hypothetical protein